jgi:hypothetical protein
MNEKDDGDARAQSGNHRIYQDQEDCIRRGTLVSFIFYYIYYNVQSLYAPFPFTKTYIDSPTRRAVFTRFFVKKSLEIDRIPNIRIKTRVELFLVNNRYNWLVEYLREIPESHR